MTGFVQMGNFYRSISCSSHIHA